MCPLIRLVGQLGRTFCNILERAINSWRHTSRCSPCRPSQAFGVVPTVIIEIPEDEEKFFSELAAHLVCSSFDTSSFAGLPSGQFSLKIARHGLGYG